MDGVADVVQIRAAPEAFTEVGLLVGLSPELELNGFGDGLFELFGATFVVDYVLVASWVEPLVRGGGGPPPTPPHTQG